MSPAHSPPMPSYARFVMSHGRCKQAATPLLFADRRRLFMRHSVSFDERGSSVDSVVPEVEDRGTEVRVMVPRVYAHAPAEVLCELVCRSFRKRFYDGTLSELGPATVAYIRSDRFRNDRLNMLKGICPSTPLFRFQHRWGTRMTRLEHEFLKLMEGPLHFVGSLMRVRSIGMLPMSEDVSRPRLAAYSDPYLRAVYFDRRVLDPFEAPLVCMIVLYRACAYIECYDLWNCRLDEGRFSLLMGMFPGYDAAMALCRERRIRMQMHRCDERLMLHA